MLVIALTGVSLIITLVALGTMDVIPRPIAGYSGIGIIVILCLIAVIRKKLKG